MFAPCHPLPPVHPPDGRLVPVPPVAAPIFPLFQCFLPCPRCVTADALVLSSPLALFTARNARDRHDRRGYNAENLEIAMMVVFCLLFWLHKQSLQASWAYTGELGRMWGRGKNGPCRARWMGLTARFNRAARIPTLLMNIHRKLKAV